jgi:hypothetical protein
VGRDVEAEAEGGAEEGLASEGNSDNDSVR